jgi:hypothetical protein
MEICFFNVSSNEQSVACSFLIIEKVLEAFRLKSARLYTKKNHEISVLYPEITVDSCIPPFLQQIRRRVDEQSIERDDRLFLNVWPYQLRNHYVDDEIIDDNTIISIASDLIGIIGRNNTLRHSQVLPRYFEVQHSIMARPRSDFVVLITPLAYEKFIEKSIKIQMLASLCAPIALIVPHPQGIKLGNLHIITPKLQDLSSALGICNAVIAGSQLDALFLGCAEKEDLFHTIVIGKQKQKFLLAENFICHDVTTDSDLVRIFMKLRK